MGVSVAWSLLTLRYAGVGGSQGASKKDWGHVQELTDVCATHSGGGPRPLGHPLLTSFTVALHLASFFFSA